MEYATIDSQRAILFIRNLHSTIRVLEWRRLTCALCRTRPRMVVQVAALQFEWAWQNPLRSRRLSADVKKWPARQRTGARGRAHVAAALLQNGGLKWGSEMMVTFTSQEAAEELQQVRVPLPDAWPTPFEVHIMIYLHMVLYSFANCGVSCMRMRLTRDSAPARGTRVDRGRPYPGRRMSRLSWAP